MGRRYWLTIALLACTQQDIFDAECAVACRKSGHDSGQFISLKKKEFCACVDYREYEQIVGKHIALPSRPRKMKIRTSPGPIYGPSSYYDDE